MDTVVGDTSLEAWEWAVVADWTQPKFMHGSSPQLDHGALSTRALFMSAVAALNRRLAAGRSLEQPEGCMRAGFGGVL
ncbi:hypothetical protein CYMTET_37270 [Cymbomonas tetramitiformis]|uniref:Uncharacterized protein n=1 Tax=Cymbomonas tetramitiformis TaxID=36881 RepID=A0AAE0CEB4_9CHLO|nr:hypothetical protein CYMTET_37270 [Cymbomonas tetramitiformis]